VDHPLGGRDDPLDLDADGIDAERLNSRRAEANPWNLSKSPSAFSHENFDLAREVADRLHVRQDTDRYRDVEPVLDLEQQVHDLQRVEREVAQEIRVFADLERPCDSREARPRAPLRSADNPERYCRSWHSWFLVAVRAGEPLFQADLRTPARGFREVVTIAQPVRMRNFAQLAGR
jgi:hypothetical protein